MSKHDNLILFFIILTICSFIGEFSIISLILFSIGYSLTITVFDFSIIKGDLKMRKITKRVLLALGIILCTIALFNEVSILCIVMFFIGFSATIWTLNSKSEESNKINNEKENTK